MSQNALTRDLASYGCRYTPTGYTVAAMHSQHTTHPDIVKRLRRALGQLNSIIEMIEDGRPCEDVAMQMQALEKAIVQAKKTFIHDHIDHCLEDTGPASPKAMRAFKQISRYL